MGHFFLACPVFIHVSVCASRSLQWNKLFYLRINMKCEKGLHVIIQSVLEQCKVIQGLRRLVKPGMINVCALIRVAKFVYKLRSELTFD